MKIFLSAVSGQFRDCRQALASDLRAVGAEVIVQEDFQQHGRTLLEKLEAYIAGCDRVIALVGDAYGSEPTSRRGRPVGRPGGRIPSGSISSPWANGSTARRLRARTSMSTSPTEDYLSASGQAGPGAAEAAAGVPRRDPRQRQGPQQVRLAARALPAGPPRRLPGPRPPITSRATCR